MATLNNSHSHFLTTTSLGSVLGYGHRNPNSLYKAIYRLEKSKIISRLGPGKYFYGNEPPMDFSVANFLIQPSYISLESALNLYGILSQFPYLITSVSTTKSKTVRTYNREFQYAHISKDLYWGFVKTDEYLIATPEKAIIDNFYLACKGFRAANGDEWDWKMVDKKRLIGYAKLIDYPPFKKYFSKHAQI